MISLNNINVKFGGFELLKDVSFLVNKDDRIGLTGKNGAGKSTLLKLISGAVEPSEGSVSMPKDVLIGYLPQEMKLTDSRTLKEETVLAFDGIIKLKKDIEILNENIANTTNYHSPEYLKMLDQLNELHERYAILGGDKYEAELEQTLIGLGFERNDFNRPTAEFSGGWRMRVELAKLLLKKPDTILLDEPTNHLDIESIQWLEDFLKNYKGAVILVSHDKAFLNMVCNRTIEISLGKITDQKMKFSDFVEWKKEQREIQMAAYRNQQKAIEETEKFVERFRYKATKAVQVQSRIKQLEKLERIEIEEEDKTALKLRFPPAPRSGKVVVEGKNITKKYEDLLVLNDIDFNIEAGEKLAFVGRNGEGKTTLVKIITGELEHAGMLQLGHNVKIGYFAQNQARLLNEELTVFDTIDEIAVGEIRTKIRDVLGAFMFSGDDVEKKVKVLSGGEKSRLAMIRLMLTPVNFLILDEPTNHLDMQSKEILKEALKSFTGTVLVVSHDREFLDGLVNCVYEFKNKKIKQYLGGIYEFLEKRKMDSLRELEVNNASTPLKINGSSKSTSQLLSFEEKKEINKNISRLQKQVSQTEEQIEKLEVKISEFDNHLSSGQVVEDNAVFEKYNQLKVNLNNLFMDWENQQKELENWCSKKNW